MIKRHTILILCSLSLILLVGCSQSEADFPIGIPLTAEHWDIEGEYITVVYDEDNTWELTFRNQYWTGGEYYIEDDILHYVTCEGCSAQQEASYRFKVRDDIVTFELVGKDLERDRRLGMQNEHIIQH